MKRAVVPFRTGVYRKFGTEQNHAAIEATNDAVAQRQLNRTNNAIKHAIKARASNSTVKYAASVGGGMRTEAACVLGRHATSLGASSLGGNAAQVGNLRRFVPWVGAGDLRRAAQAGHLRAVQRAAPVGGGMRVEASVRGRRATILGGCNLGRSAAPRRHAASVAPLLACR